MKVIHNLYFHPLCAYPGPWYCAISRVWFGVGIFRGDLHFRVQRLHELYGDIVRIAPNELSYIAPEAWPAIEGI